MESETAGCALSAGMVVTSRCSGYTQVLSFLFLRKRFEALLFFFLLSPLCFACLECEHSALALSESLPEKRVERGGKQTVCIQVES